MQEVLDKKSDGTVRTGKTKSTSMGKADKMKKILKNNDRLEE